MKKFCKVIGWIFGVILVLYLVMLFVNIQCNAALRNYIEEFEPVSYPDDRIVPEKNGEYYTITTDDTLEIMHITDIHIGGGFWTYKKDKKTIYELITMLQKEAPDIVILGGDNTYCIPAVGFNGGNTLNNKMVAKTVISLFEHEEVYFTTVFGNHDTESIDYASREDVAKVYMDDHYKYCFFDQNFKDADAPTVPSETNQIILVRKTDGTLLRALLLVDSNAYVDTSLTSTIFAKYDVIHQAQIDWAKEALTDISRQANLPEGEYVKTFAFMHIPVGEYRAALDDLIIETKDEEGNPVSFEVNENPLYTEYISGEWGEEKVCYGGLNNDGAAVDQDLFFETLCDEMQCVDGIFCGHDHCINAVVKYKGVLLDYGYSLDNIAYGSKMSTYGRQRGATVIELLPDSEVNIYHRNAYLDYGCETDKFYDVDVDGKIYPEWYRTIE